MARLVFVRMNEDHTENRKKERKTCSVPRSIGGILVAFGGCDDAAAFLMKKTTQKKKKERHAASQESIGGTCCFERV